MIVRSLHAGESDSCRFHNRLLGAKGLTSRGIFRINCLRKKNNPVLPETVLAFKAFKLVEGFNYLLRVFKGPVKNP